MRVVLDTNVFVSGIFWKGDSYQVLNTWREGKFILLTSIETIIEVAKVLKDFKIQLLEEERKGWISLIIQNSYIIEPKEKISIIKDDPKDDIFIETAIAGKADYIVSKDNHLLKVKEFRRIKIVTPEEFLKIIK